MAPTKQPVRNRPRTNHRRTTSKPKTTSKTRPITSSLESTVVKPRTRARTAIAKRRKLVLNSKQPPSSNSKTKRTSTRKRKERTASSSSVRRSDGSKRVDTAKASNCRRRRRPPPSESPRSKPSSTNEEAPSSSSPSDDTVPSPPLLTTPIPPSDPIISRIKQLSIRREIQWKRRELQTLADCEQSILRRIQRLRHDVTGIRLKLTGNNHPANDPDRSNPPPLETTKPDRWMRCNTCTGCTRTQNCNACQSCQTQPGCKRGKFPCLNKRCLSPLRTKSNDASSSKKQQRRKKDDGPKAISDAEELESMPNVDDTDGLLSRASVLETCTLQNLLRDDDGLENDTELNSETAPTEHETDFALENAISKTARASTRSEPSMDDQTLQKKQPRRRRLSPPSKSSARTTTRRKSIAEITDDEGAKRIMEKQSAISSTDAALPCCEQPSKRNQGSVVSKQAIEQTPLPEEDGVVVSREEKEGLQSQKHFPTKSDRKESISMTTPLTDSIRDDDDDGGICDDANGKEPLIKTVLRYNAGTVPSQGNTDLAQSMGLNRRLYLELREFEDDSEEEEYDLMVNPPPIH